MQVLAPQPTEIKKLRMRKGLAGPLVRWSAYASNGVLDNATLRSKISLYYGCFLLLLHLTEKLLFHRL